MWKLPKGEDFLPNTTLIQLENFYAAEKRAKPKIRLLCATHRKKGASMDNIFEITSLKKSNRLLHPAPLPRKRHNWQRRHQTNR
jgi:hypothetical protein